MAILEAGNHSHLEQLTLRPPGNHLVNVLPGKSLQPISINPSSSQGKQPEAFLLCAPQSEGPSDSFKPGSAEREAPCGRHELYPVLGIQAYYGILCLPGLNPQTCYTEVFLLSCCSKTWLWPDLGLCCFWPMELGHATSLPRSPLTSQYPLTSGFCG